MPLMMAIGVTATIFGLLGLIYCVVKATGAKRSGLQGEGLTNYLRSLIAVNLASFFLSAVGLCLILVSILL